MRLSRRVSLSGQQSNRQLGSQKTRKKHNKHKKLDDICENVYSSNHNSVKIENNDETEPRRSMRVRRAPVVLDASPSPAKKRRRVEFRSESSSLQKGKRVKKEPSLEKESDSWGDRLRDRARKGKRPKRDNFPRMKKRLFKVEDMDSSDDLGVGSSMSRVVKSKRPGRIKASNVSKNAHEERDSSSDEEESSENEDDKANSESSDGEENGKVDKGDSGESDEDRESDEVEEGETSESDEDGEESEKDEIGNYLGKKEAKEHREKVDGDREHSSESDEEEEADEMEERKPSGSEEEGEQAEENEVKDDKGENGVGDDGENNGMDVHEEIEKEEVKENKNKKADEIKITVQSEDNVLVELEKSIADRENQMDFLNAEVGISNEKPVNDENVKKSLCGTNDRRYLRVGRRCGLCGTGTDGKPPRTLVEYGYNSDHEVAYSGSSASEDIKYDTNDGFGEEPGWLGRLLGPINDRYGIAGIFVHQNCAVWSPEVYFSGLNCLKNVRAALFRGRVLKCTRCSRPGATSGCRVDRCPKTYHLPCARANGCIFDHKKFLIACTDHRHLFQPHGIQSLHKIKKMKAKKLKLELRKVSGDAWRKDLEAEEKYLENCGEDEEFLKRESKRLHRDLLRIAPVFIGGSKCDEDSQFQGFESVAGLQNVIQSLKEVVILPLLYPEFFSNMGITPPRGVLLHGYPGTGKTLVVRALIGACAQGDKRIAYFARKGADCLGKYVGDAERQLRLLFQVAEKSQPSIIFFDEIDGLAPCRTRQSDQTHNSVVSTLLALMDGLKSRGSVVVIGATNRPDSVDSALRRPGRFDREIYFPLPSENDREAILSLHTRKWPKPVTGSLLKQIAKRTVGFAGADLQSLCTQAAITALRRSCPLQEILYAAENKGPLGKHPPLPFFSVEERDWLETLTHAPPPCSQRGTEMAANDVASSPLHTHLVPCLLQPLSVLLASISRDKRIYLPSQLHKAAEIVKTVVVSALERKQISTHNWWSHIHEMVLEPDVLKDVEINLCRRGILYGQENYSSSFQDEKKLESHCSIVPQFSTRPGFLKNVTCALDKKIGFFLLISGDPRSGQRYLASCLLHCFTGNVEIQKLDSATISQEGQGDFMLGVNRILMKCASVGSSLIFMPRIDLWAMDTYIQLDGVESDSSIKNSPGEEGQEVPANMSQKTSVVWDMFVEQVESISVSSSLTILATSALPSDSLPGGIKQFFNSGKLNNRSSSPFEETIPRFSLSLDGRFSNDNVIKFSTTELSKDLAQQFVQLSHQSVHVHSIPYTNLKSFDNADNHEPANENVTAEVPESSVPQFSNPANSRPSKGKSNLMLTISTMGYQILTYPHFAELCWATSKLKEGPCNDTRGPWKGWPFNPCIVRPEKSSTHLAETCSSNNYKNRENFGLVRGLIAVGLSAYRGTYTTVREVSSEVRKVLELFADQINAKICAGKHPSQYIRILSQMAYFEDVVNSWAYSQQSLEETAQATIPPISCFTDVKSCDHMPSEDIIERKKGAGLDVSNKNSENTTEQKDGGESAKSSGQLLEKSTENTDLNKPMEQDKQNPDGGLFANEPREKVVFNHPSDNGVCASILPNGYAKTKTVIINEDGPRSSNVGSEDSNCKDSCNQHNEMTIEENVSFENSNLGSTNGQNNATKNGLSNDSRVICFYRCCSECLIKLRKTIEKILAYEWGLRDDGNFTVEDVHDLVASVSMNLHSKLRKIFVADWPKGEGEMKQDNVRGVFKNQEKDTSQGKGFENGYLGPQECKFHSTTNQDSQQENDLKFVCRDGVMSQLTSEEVASLDFHCKFDNICLCSLIELIVMTKQPLG